MEKNGKKSTYIQSYTDKAERACELKKMFVIYILYIDY